MVLYLNIIISHNNNKCKKAFIIIKSSFLLDKIYFYCIIDTDVIGDVVEAADKFVDASGEVTTTIPKDGDGFVTMKDENGIEIGMSLPKDLNTEEGIATDNGTVVYQSDESADVCVQSITKAAQDGITLDSVRELVLIKDKEAPKEYVFNFDLPEGYRLVTSEAYCAVINSATDFDEDNPDADPGFIYIVDGNDEIQAVVDVPWAKDANGNDVKTDYTIKGLTLVQHVDFNENNVFPIVADPTTSKKVHVGTSSGTKYNSKKTKKLTYTIKTYKFYKKAEHSTTWRYNYTEYHWSWTGYKKSGGDWVKDKSRSGVDRVHNDPQSFMESYF